MLRGVGLTLLCLAAIAAPAEASDRGGAVNGGAVAAQQGMTTARMQAATQEQAGPARVTVVSPRAQPALRTGSVGGFRREEVNQPVRSASLLSQRRERQDSFAFPWLRQGRSGLAVPLTERLLLGLRYRHLEGEDLWPEFADTGASDYHSHHVLIRASWRF